jgi:hypothetical protein
MRTKALAGSKVGTVRLWPAAGHARTRAQRAYFRSWEVRAPFSEKC